VEDREIVAAVVAGDPAGLAEAYDRYAAALYTYCRTMLRESADASDVVQDTFVIASTRLAQLRDPSKLRTWLYAVARNECYRRLRGKESPGLDEVPDVTDESEAVGAQAERVELQRLVHDALIGMNTGDREVIELMIRHDFEGTELGEALGVPRNHAHAMLSRARNQLKTSLGALLVARTGRDSCAVLDEMLSHWDGTMTVLLRKQINRHIENCDICSERRRRELAPAALFSLLPLAALPPGLRERILRLCADNSPSAVRYRQQVSQRAGSFQAGGFPGGPGIPLGARLGSARRGALLTLPAAAVLLVAVVVIVALASGGKAPSDNTAAAGRFATSATSATSATGSSGTPPTAPASSVAAGPGSRGASPSSQAAAVAQSPTAGQGTQPSTTQTQTQSPTHHASPSPKHTSPAPSRSPSRSPSPSPSPSPTTAVPGKLTVSAGTVQLSQGAAGGPPTGSLVLTAVGGPVMGWTVSIPGSANGLLSASPASGVLGSGQSVTVTFTLARPVSFHQQVTINPGGLPVTVEFTPVNTDAILLARA
jgi:RNA polymerase sigma factor (sigma-70 family)